MTLIGLLIIKLLLLIVICYCSRYCIPKQYAKNVGTLNDSVNVINFISAGRKSGLVVSILDSRLEGHGFKSHPILDENGVKTMTGSIPAPNAGSFNN